MPVSLSEFISSNFQQLMEYSHEADKQWFQHAEPRLAPDLELSRCTKLFEGFDGAFILNNNDLKSQYEGMLAKFNDGLPDAKEVRQFLVLISSSAGQLVNDVIKKNRLTNREQFQKDYIIHQIQQALIIAITDSILKASPPDPIRNTQNLRVQRLLIEVQNTYVYNLDDYDDDLSANDEEAENRRTNALIDVFYSKELLKFVQTDHFKKIDSQNKDKKFSSREEFIKQIDSEITDPDFRALPKKYREIFLKRLFVTYVNLKHEDSTYPLFLTQNQIQDYFFDVSTRKIPEDDAKVRVISSLLKPLARNFEADTMLYQMLEVHLTDGFIQLLEGKSIESILPDELTTFLKDYDHFEAQLDKLKNYCNASPENNSALGALYNSLDQARDDLQMNKITIKDFKDTCDKAILAVPTSDIWVDYIQPMLSAIKAVFLSYVKWENTTKTIHDDVTTPLRNNMLDKTAAVRDVKEAIRNLKGLGEDANPDPEHGTTTSGTP